MARASDYVIFSGPMRTDFALLDFIEDFADDYKLMRGHAVAPDWPNDVCFRMSPDFKKRIKLSDNLVNSNKFLVASEPLQDLPKSKPAYATTSSSCLREATSSVLATSTTS